MASPDLKRAEIQGDVSGVSPDRIMQLGLDFMASKTLLSAAELGVFTRLAGNPTDVEAPSRQLGLHPRSARDFLDALVALGFLERNAQVYSNTPEADYFPDSEEPTYIGGLLEMCNARRTSCRTGFDGGWHQVRFSG